MMTLMLNLTVAVPFLSLIHLSGMLYETLVCFSQGCVNSVQEE